MKKKETEFGHQCIDRLFESSKIVIKQRLLHIVLKEQEHPALSIEHENLLFLSMLNAKIDFDFI